MRKESETSSTSAGSFPCCASAEPARIQLTGPVPDLLDLVADNVAVDGVVPMAGPYECDYVVGSMSVPWRCGATLERVSGKPYFQAQAATFPLRGMLNVGLVWRGNAAYAKDVDRSLPLSAFCPLLEIPGCGVLLAADGRGRQGSHRTRLGRFHCRPGAIREELACNGAANKTP